MVKGLYEYQFGPAEFVRRASQIRMYALGLAYLVAECDDAPNLIDYVPCEGVPCPHWPPPCPPTCDEEDGPDDYPFR